MSNRPLKLSRPTTGLRNFRGDLNGSDTHKWSTDHGNICVDTIFRIIIMHSFPDIEENMFFDNGGPHLHTHNMHIILQHFK